MMTQRIGVKICGLKTVHDIQAVVQAGAGYGGLVFAPSVRQVTISQAKALVHEFPFEVASVGLFVNAPLDEIKAVLDEVPLTMLQLHGAETPEYINVLQDEFGLPVMKAVSVETYDDLKTAKDYADVADMLLFDAKAPSASAQAGGHGKAFDWSILSGFRLSKPWFLAGGLNPDNVTDAIIQTKARLVDVSSGVEKEKGVKDESLIHQFVNNAKAGFSVRRTCANIPD